MSENRPAILMLEDGTTFSGKSFGAIGKTLGEVCFNTGITGYQEVLTDPSYYGQLVVFTYPEIGNTGVNKSDNEALHPSVRGVVVREFTKHPSNWRCKQSFDDWLQHEGVVGICGVDTRALVRHIRTAGSMNGVVCTDGLSSPIQLLE